jgi:UDP-galactopyranose mutase
MSRIAVVGAGFSGAVIARELAEAGNRVTVFESRDYLAGNCHTYRDESTNILIHKHGPHVFHTNDEDVFQYVSRFGRLLPYINRVKAVRNNRVYSLPINLHTINQFFGGAMSPKEAEAFISSKAHKSILSPQNFKQQALSFVGQELYDAFFEGYTRKQWGVDPELVPAHILSRLPVRFSYDDNYYNHRYQGMPEHGYSAIIEAMIDHDNICLRLSSEFTQNDKVGYEHTFFSGSIDSYYRYKYGVLGYRTLDFEQFCDVGDYQGCAVINYCDPEIPFTRITEHKHFAPWETHKNTVCSKEYSREFRIGDIPYYPVRLVEEEAMLRKYIDEAEGDNDITFVGRLGTYRYLDMDVTVKEAIMTVREFLSNRKENLKQPAFVNAPI